MQEVRETCVWFLGREDPREEEMATCTSVLAWKIPQAEEPGGLQSMWLKRTGPHWAIEHKSRQNMCSKAELPTQ